MRWTSHLAQRVLDWLVGHVSDVTSGSVGEALGRLKVDKVSKLGASPVLCCVILKIRYNTGISFMLPLVPRLLRTINFSIFMKTFK